MTKGCNPKKRSSFSPDTGFSRVSRDETSGFINTNAFDKLTSPLTLPLSLKTVSQSDAWRRSRRIQKIQNAGVLGMGNFRRLKMGCFHVIGTFESEPLKVTAPNLFYPTASPLFQTRFFHIATQSPCRERGRSERK